MYLEMIDDNDRNFQINQSLSRFETKCHCLFIIYCYYHKYPFELS